MSISATASHGDVDSPAAWLRLGAALLLCTLGGVGMWSVVVALPEVQAEFGVARGAASVPYTLTMLGYATGGVMMGRLADRFGVAWPVAAGAVMLSLGYVAAGLAQSLWQFTLVQGVLIGFCGGSATFGPLMADTSLWFLRRRGLAVAICASGNYLAGTIWPPIVQHFIAVAGWRQTHIGIGLFCAVTMLPLVLFLRRRAPVDTPAQAAASTSAPLPIAGMSPSVLQGMLATAGLACCVAMAMPQVHIVAYCGDLGYGVARGAEMLSLMLGFGVVSRLASGLIADRIGGLRTVLFGSLGQALSLGLYFVLDGLTSLYVVSAIFGLVQGGIVPGYAVVVREVFPAREAGTRISTTLMATIVGMALGGWMSGEIFDYTGSYRAAFANGIAWNIVNAGIVTFLLLRQQRRRQFAVA